MKLSLLPDLVFPVTPKQVHPLVEMVEKLNLLGMGLNPRQQKALDIMLETYELKAKSGGDIDYTGIEGHRRLFADAMAFCGDGCAIVTRHGDAAAAHLAINFNNAQRKLEKAGMNLLPWEVMALLELCRDICALPPRSEDRMGLFLSYLRKERLVV